MRYILTFLLITVLVLFTYYSIDNEKFEPFDEDKIISDLVCTDVITEQELLNLKISKDGENLSLNEATERAIILNKKNPGESYEGIHKKSDGHYYFCKNIEITNNAGDVQLIKNTLDGDIEFNNSSVGIKDDPLPGIMINNGGTMLVKDKLCLPKKDGKVVCITSDDIYRLKNLPINIPREKKFCLNKFNENGGEEQACIEKKHLQILNGSAMINLKHMDYSKPKYGNRYVKYETINHHGTHNIFRHQWYNGMYLNKGSGRRITEYVGNSLGVLKLNNDKNDAMEFGFNVSTPKYRSSLVGTDTLSLRR
jgi:hypothetical protein